jgi:hypothetical protein
MLQLGCPAQAARQAMEKQLTGSHTDWLDNSSSDINQAVQWPWLEACQSNNIRDTLI